MVFKPHVQRRRRNQPLCHVCYTICLYTIIFFESVLHEVTSAILVPHINETAAKLASQTHPVWIELFSHVKLFSCPKKICLAAAHVDENAP